MGFGSCDAIQLLISHTETTVLYQPSLSTSFHGPWREDGHPGERLEGRWRENDSA